MLALLPLLAFAGGGDVLANRPALVGERGPELFMPRTAGRIIPNHELGGGCPSSPIFNFDASRLERPGGNSRGGHDGRLQHIVAAAVQATHQGGKRSPSGR